MLKKDRYTIPALRGKNRSEEADLISPTSSSFFGPAKVCYDQLQNVGDQLNKAISELLSLKMQKKMILPGFLTSLPHCKKKPFDEMRMKFCHIIILNTCGTPLVDWNKLLKNYCKYQNKEDAKLFLRAAEKIYAYVADDIQGDPEDKLETHRIMMMFYFNYIVNHGLYRSEAGSSIIHRKLENLVTTYYESGKLKEKFMSQLEPGKLEDPGLQLLLQLKQAVLDKIYPLFRLHTCKNTYKELMEIYFQFGDLDEAYRLFDQGRSNPEYSCWGYYHEIGLKILFSLVLEDGKNGLTRAKEYYDELRATKNHSLNSHCHRELLALYGKEIEIACEERKILLLDEAQEIYYSIPNTEDLKPAPVRETMLTLFLANKKWLEAQFFFDREIRGIEIRDSAYRQVIKYFYLDGHYEKATAWLVDAINNGRLTGCYPRFSASKISENLVFEINLHKGGQSGGGISLYGGLDEKLLPIIIHFLFQHIKEKFYFLKSRKEKMDKLNINIITGIPANESMSVKSNVSTILEAYDFAGKINCSLRNLGCIELNLNIRDILENEKLDGYYNFSEKRLSFISLCEIDYIESQVPRFL